MGSKLLLVSEMVLGATKTRDFYFNNCIYLRCIRNLLKVHLKILKEIFNRVLKANSLKKNIIS